MGTEKPGRRLGQGATVYAEGDYGRDDKGQWWARPPGGHLADLSEHTVLEHADGTITVAPSLLQPKGDNGGVLFHGYLTRGVWYPC
jgi:hypothetical protein